MSGFCSLRKEQTRTAQACYGFGLSALLNDLTGIDLTNLLTALDLIDHMPPMGRSSRHGTPLLPTLNSRVHDSLTICCAIVDGPKITTVPEVSRRQSDRSCSLLARCVGKETWQANSEAAA